MEWTEAMPVASAVASNDTGDIVIVESVTEDVFAEPVLAAAPAGSDDLDFHLLNIPPKPARELRMR